MNKNSKIYVAGHKGLVGSAIVRELEGQGYTNLVFRTHSELDLINYEEVKRFYEVEKPEYVFLAAAKVGGILANSTYPADFIYQNLQIQNNVIHNSYLSKVKKLIFLGSSCIYPKLCPQPIKEEYLLTSELEPTNEAYAIAKIAGLKMCESYNRQYGTSFISAMPTNLYGINDSFDTENGHVIPSLISRIHNAKMKNLPSVKVWGTGKPKREFLFSDDLARACIFLVNNSQDNKIVNIGCGEDLEISSLVDLMCDVIGYKGKIEFDTSKPDGTPRKVLDISTIKNLGWYPTIDLRSGLKLTYDWYLKAYAHSIS